MNMQLIQHNIKQLEALAGQNNPAEAAKAAFALAKLMLQSPSGASPRSLYGAYGGAVAAMQASLDALLSTYCPTEDMEQMLQKIQEANEQIASCAAESEQVAAANGELLSRQQALEKSRQELADRKANIEKLVAIKETEIPALKKEIATLEEKLSRLETESEAALAARAKWQAVFDEDLHLIGGLPQSVQDKTADEIIAAAKDYAGQAALAAAEGDEWLRKVIAAVEESKERMKQADRL